MGFSNNAQQQRDLDGARINPSTEDKQDTIISLLGGVTGGLATRFLPDSADSNIYYAGFAPIASVENAAVWQIQKIDFTNGVEVYWCDGDQSYNNNWTNREALTYS